MTIGTQFTNELNRITLNFPDEREEKYREYYFARSYKTVRIAFLILSALYAFFGYLDSIITQEYFEMFILLRIVVVVEFLAIFVFTYFENFKRYWQTLVFFSYLLAAGGIIVMLVVLPDVVIYSSGLILVFLAGSVLVKLRFFASSVASAIVIIAYIVAAASLNVDVTIIVSNSFFFIGANLIGMLAAYYTEIFNRQNFNLYLEIASKNEEIEEANKNLEEKVEARTKLLISRNKELKEEVKHRAIVEKQLIAAKEKAEESDKLKSAFLANMSHEIRTPMNGILGFANLLKEAESEEELDEFIDTIINSGEHLLNLINDIIDLSKIEAGILKIEKSKFEINTLMKEIFDMFSVENNVVSKKLKLAYKNDLDDDDCLIYTDRMRLKQIMINLVNNACKYTDEGSIEFYYEIHKNDLFFKVKDTGIGINEEAQKFIFDRFMQATVGRTSGRESTGLGLAITKTYLNLMGGKIAVKSKLNEGSEFYFTLPAVVVKTQVLANDGL